MEDRQRFLAAPLTREKAARFRSVTRKRRPWLALRQLGEHALQVGAADGEAGNGRVIWRKRSPKRSNRSASSSSESNFLSLQLA